MTKTVLITGASSGLGAVTAKNFAKKGFNVVVNYFSNQSAAEQIVAKIGNDHAIAVQADVRDRASVENLVALSVKHFGSIDVLVNNALVGFKFDPIKQKAFKDLSWSDYQKQIDGTLKGAFNTTQSVLSEMIKNKHGKVINIGTNLFQNPVVPYHEYTTSKAALLGFTRNLATELGQDGISVNMVSGGLLRTTNASSVTTPEVFNMIAAQTPLREVTTPEQVAKMVVFLGSEDSDGITGQNYTVDGGLTMN